METETKPLWVTRREAMGKTWSVELWPESDMNREGTDLGTVRSSRQRIRINAAMPMNSRDSTVLHEIIEAVNGDLALKVDHDVIDRLEVGLFAFLRGFGLWNEFPWPDKE